MRYEKPKMDVLVIEGTVIVSVSGGEGTEGNDNEVTWG